MKIRNLAGVLSAFVTAALLASPAGAQSPAPLAAQKPIVLPGVAARFDYMNVDTGKQRLLAAHTKAGSLTVIDLKTNTVLTSIPVGTIQGIVVDTANDQYITGNSADHRVVFVDRTTFKIKGEVPTDGPVDDLELDTKTGMIYADHDDGTDVWVINARSRKLVGSVKIPEAPEYIRYDPVSDRLYQNIKSNDTVQVINPATNTVESIWQTSPASGPHGLALDSDAGRVYSAGNKGKLAVFDIKSGKHIATVDIAAGTDQIAYDPELKRVYCASKGYISVVQATGTAVRLMDNVPVAAGAHTIAVDPNTHSVWICYSDSEHSYVQEFTVAKK